MIMFEKHVMFSQCVMFRVIDQLVI